MIARLAVILPLALAAPAFAQSTAVTPLAPLGGQSVGGAAGPAGFAADPRSWRASLPARPDQVRRGYAVRSTSGGWIGTVAHADARGAVVVTQHSAVRVPLNAFGVTTNGLLLDVSPERFEALASAAGGARGS